MYITFCPEVRRLRIDNHLVEQIIGIGILVDDEEYVPYVGDYRALVAALVLYVAGKALPVAVEVDTDQFAAAVEYGASRVAAGGVGVGDEVYGHLAPFV